MREFLASISGLMVVLMMAAAFPIPASAHESIGKMDVVEKSDLPKCPSWFLCRP